MLCTFHAGFVGTKALPPVWFLIVAGLLLGLGFWFYGYHIIRAIGNKITQISQNRGFSIELGAAITVVLTSRHGVPDDAVLDWNYYGHRSHEP